MPHTTLYQVVKKRHKSLRYTHALSSSSAPNKASDMYTCCSKSVELLVKASGRCGVIVTEIAKSNHFKGCCSSSSSSFFYTMFHLL